MQHQRFALLFAILGLLACGSAGDPSNGFPEGAGAGGGAGSAGSGSSKGGAAGAGGGLGSSGSSGSAGAADDCGGVGKVVYVVSSDDELLTFEPQKSVFTLIGKLKCPSSGHPFSMAVNRQGFAFVLYDDKNIYRVNTADAACTATQFAANQNGGWSEFGMGYVSNTAGSSLETLYVMDNGSKGLGTISDAGVLTTVKPFDATLAGRSGEVTGTGDGRLFGFFVDTMDASKTSVAEVDKTTAKTLSNTKQNLPTINAWAFAFWGGSFYLFNGTGSSPSRVHKYTPATPSAPATTTQVVADAGYRIVGAGVSTCAPLVEPQPK